MKKVIAFITAVIAVSLLTPIAEAGHSKRKIVGYNQCGDPLYATYRIVSYQRCGRPIYGWVRDRCTSSCTRPGRCNHHGHARSNRCSSSRISIGFGKPRISIHSTHVRRCAPVSKHRWSSSSRSRRGCR